MKLSTSYRQILSISFPIMIGSAAQNVITLTDGIFLGRVGEVELGAIGFVGVFYLIIAAIGYGFSKGGQIMIARRMGEGNKKVIGNLAYSMLAFELSLAIIMFLFMKYGSAHFLHFFVNSEQIYEKSLEYLEYRSYGIFFSYLGVAIIALYTGVGRTTFIIYDTIVLGVVNIILNYGLIFGDFGLPRMGIAGAGLASTIAEAVAFVMFFIYILFDKEAHEYQLFKMPSIDFSIIKQQYKLSTPVVAQAIVGLGSSFLFFSIVENLGERELAITNLVRMLYLTMSIPIWGLCSGIHTIVSNFIGQRKRQGVIPVILKTSYLSLGITLLITIPMLLFPYHVLSVGTDNSELIEAAIPTLYVLGVLMAFFSVGAVFFNGLVGTGATLLGLKLQSVCVLFYVLYIYVVVEVIHGSLELAWSAEIVYWIFAGILSYYFLAKKVWYDIEI